MRLPSLILFLSGVCAGCAPLQSLPPEDPAWRAAIAERDQSIYTGQPFVRASAGQQRATEQVKAYLLTLLPSSNAAFVKRLEQQNFSCNAFASGDVRQCFYTRARPPVACLTSLRVSVEVNFPYTDDPHSTISQDDIDVAAMVVPDPDHRDDRGCLPM